MKSLFKIVLTGLVGLSVVGCYNDFDNPAPAKIYSDADFSSSQIISVAELKTLYPLEVGGKAVVDKDYVIRGKVISSDEDGNVYKSLYLLDTSCNAGIEIKLTTGNYIMYPVSSMVYVKLQGLTLGDYRCMMSVGKESANTSYANDNIEDAYMIKAHIFPGEQLKAVPSDTLVVNSTNYTTLTDASLGRLIRFEGIESKFGKASWGYKNVFPNYFANSTSFDNTSANDQDANDPKKWSNINEWATWAHSCDRTGEYGRVTTTYYYGSAWFTYNDSSNIAGNYVVRSSGYARFKDRKIPASGAKVDITGIYTRFAKSRTDNGQAAYQLVLNSAKDVVVK